MGGTNYTLLDYHSIEYIWEADTWMSMIDWHMLELGLKCVFKLNFINYTNLNEINKKIIHAIV
jgi:hypothetical protein